MPADSVTCTVVLEGMSYWSQRMHASLGASLVIGLHFVALVKNHKPTSRAQFKKAAGMVLLEQGLHWLWYLFAANLAAFYFEAHSVFAAFIEGITGPAIVVAFIEHALPTLSALRGHKGNSDVGQAKANDGADRIADKER